MSYEVQYKIEAIDRISKVFRSIHSLDVKTEKGVAKLNTTLNKTSRQGGISLNRLKSNFISLEKRVDRIPKKIANGFSKMADGLGPIGSKIAGIFALHTIKEFTLGTINAASDLNEATSFAQVQFGKNFQMVSKFAKSAADDIGLSEAAAFQATSKFADLFGNVGFNGLDTADMSIGITKLVSDIASAKDMDLSTVSASLFSGLTGESQALKGLGIVINDTYLKNKALEMGLISNTKNALSPQIKVMATYAAIMDKTQKVQGDFARTSDSFANQQRISIANWNEISATVGKVFLPYALKAQEWGLNAMNWIQANDEKIKSWGSSILSAAKWLGGFYTVLKVTTTGFMIYDAVVAGGGILSFIRNSNIARASTLLFNGVLGIAKLGMIAFNLVVSLNPFAWIGIAIGGIVLLYQNWDSVKQKLGVIWQAFAVNPFNWMIEFMDKRIPGFAKAFEMMWSKVKNMFSDGLGWIKEKLGQFASWLGLDDLFNFSVTPEYNIPKGGKRNYGKSKEGSSGVLGINSGLSKPEKNTKSPIKERMAGLVEGGGKQIKNITITIDKLVESLIIQTQTVGMSNAQVKAEMSRVLMSAVNDSNYQ